MRYISGFVRLGSVLAGLAVGAHAQTTFLTNLDQTPSNSPAPVDYTTGSFVNAATEFQAFTLGSTINLSSITLDVVTGGGPSLQVSIAQYNGPTSPGVVLQTLSGPDTVAPNTQYTYNTASTLTLQAGSTYFIELSAGTSNSTYMTFATTNPGTFSSTNGSTMTGDIQDYSLHNGLYNDNGYQLQFSASGISAVPEPSTYALIAGAAALGFAAYRRRKAVAA